MHRLFFTNSLNTAASFPLRAKISVNLTLIDHSYAYFCSSIIMSKPIVFIVNPFSGVGKQRLIEQRVDALLDRTKYVPLFHYTEKAGHATTLAKEAVKAQIDIVVAVGGDGSVNEVAKGIIGTDTTLGIIPTGSGNGFAMHLGIGRQVDKAIQILNQGNTAIVDTCTINEHPFVNLAGVGFDAHIAYHIKKSSFRGLKGYIWQSLLHTYRYQMPTIDIVIDDKKMTKHCFVAEVANAPMFGYNFEIAPQAKLNDGILDIVIVKKAPKWRYFLSAWRFFNGSFHKSSLTEVYTGKEVIITCRDELAVHFDGEGFLTNKELHFRIKPRSLKVMVP